MNFTKEELETLLMLIEIKLEKLEETKSLCSEYGTDTPIYIGHAAEQFNSIRNKIINDL